jgi:lipoyl(octanoyl) transferase
MEQNKKVLFQHLGTIDYQAGWDYQEKVFTDIVNRKISNRNLPSEEQQITSNYLFFCEHPHVYTLGKSGELNHLLLAEDDLAAHQATFYKINRGGDITYHGPGQLVGYPILDLDNFFTDIHLYLRKLEEAVILTLADYGLQSGRIPGLTGVWLSDNPLGEEIPVNPRKICALGVKSSRWVTMHGFALNVNTDLSYFNHIVPCGIADKAVTSMAQELGQPQDMQEVGQKLLKHLSNLFGMEVVTEVVVAK